MIHGVHGLKNGLSVSERLDTDDPRGADHAAGMAYPCTAALTERRSQLAGKNDLLLIHFFNPFL